MKNKPLVSIIIPCYNGEKTLNRCLESVLSQTYKNLEVITVNDGSTDDTENVILSYKQRFESEGMHLKYIYQENQGLGGAINGGLAVFSGDYLCWIDCDDFLFSESVRIRMEYLENHPEFAVATSNAYVFDECDLVTPKGNIADGLSDLDNPNQFELHLRGKSIFCAGCHMVRTSAFLDVIPSRRIYPARRGQNWQMLLPVYYKYKRVFIDKPLYGYILYENAMSHGDETKEQWAYRYNEHLDIIVNTLNSIDMEACERNKYLKIYKRIFARQMYYLGIEHKDFMMFTKYFSQLVLLGDFKFVDFKRLVCLVINKVKR